MRIAAIICAAGQGKRMGIGKNKQFLELGGKPLLVHTLQRWQQFERVQQLVVVVSETDLEEVTRLIQKYHLNHVTHVTIGGNERQDSVYQGLQALKANAPDIVLIHDGARPFIQGEQIDQLIEAVHETHAAVLAVPVKDTIKKVDSKKNVTETLNRAELWAIQTPQAFTYSVILGAHKQAQQQGITATDDAALVERLGRAVKVVQGHEYNIKLTTQADIQLAAFILQTLDSEQQERTKGL